MPESKAVTKIPSKCNKPQTYLKIFSLAAMEIFFLLGRILFGGFFVLNGLGHLNHTEELSRYAASKKVPLPKIATIFSGTFILLGGTGIIFGVLVPISIILISIFLLSVSFKMHAFWKIPETQEKTSEKVNFLKNMALLGAALTMLAISQPWPWSL